MLSSISKVGSSALLKSPSTSQGALAASFLQARGLQLFDVSKVHAAQTFVLQEYHKITLYTATDIQ